MCRYQIVLEDKGENLQGITAKNLLWVALFFGQNFVAELIEKKNRHDALHFCIITEFL
jgi:hypothetical protein